VLRGSPCRSSNRHRSAARDELLFETPLWERAAEHYGRPSYQVHRADLLGLLDDALPAELLRLGVKVAAVEQDEDSATAVLGSGERCVRWTQIHHRRRRHRRRRNPLAR
jgi:hypothetical protein